MAATETGVWDLQQVRDKQLASEWTYEALEPSTLFSWGGNGNGQLGQNNLTTYSSPKQIPGTTWTRVNGSMSGYGQSMLGLKTDNTLWSWGRASNGALAQNNVAPQSSPIQIGTDTTWSANFSQGLLCGMGVKTDGTLWSWGTNENGTLGLNEQDVHRSSPTQVGIDTDWSTTADQCAMGGNSTMAGTCMKTDGSLWIWGSNTYGVLGQNDRTNRSSPVQIPGTTWSYINKPYQTMGAIKSDGTLWTWGADVKGSLGQNTGDGVRCSSPTQIGSDTTWRKIVSGNYGAISTKTDGTLWYQGSNGYGSAGQNLPMGPGGQNSRSSPVQIGTSTDWNDIAVSLWTRYANKTDGTMWGWGRGDGGSLFTPGIGNANRSSPTQLQGGATDFTGSLSACYGRAVFNVRPL